jgi:hypothetical protein
MEMTEQPPNVPEQPNNLDYRAPGDEPRNVGKTRVWQGVLAGLLLSAFWWFSGINNYFHQRLGYGILGGMVLLLLLKIVASIVAISFPRWRRFGVGLLLSIGLVVLIFFGTCAVILSH